MDLQDILALLKFLNKSELKEFRYKKGDFEILVRTKHYSKEKGKAQTTIVPAMHPTTMPTPAESPAETPPPKEQKSEGDKADKKEYLEIRSPMVGTFYRAPAPDKPPYVKVGDKIQKGDVVCIIEAMKLFNEIESEVSGTIVKVLVEDATPVEYDQVLFLVEPD